MPFPAPRLLLSQCLELDACRYNGRMIPSPAVRLLEPHVELVPVCPEVQIGLGVPRPPIQLVAGDAPGAARLVQPSTGLDLSDRMSGWARSFLDETAAVDGVVLKSRSPSCGIRGVKVHSAEDGPPVREEPGAFARVVLERYPRVAVEDEIRMNDDRARHHFLTRIFASARLREAVKGGRGGLLGFHTGYKLVLMAHSPEGLRSLGSMVAETDDDNFTTRAHEYAELFAAVLSEPAGVGANINVIQHARGYFKDDLSGGEKGEFDDLERRYREGEVPLPMLLRVLRGWADRFGAVYLQRQAYLRPYPDELLRAAGPGDEPTL